MMEPKDMVSFSQDGEKLAQLAAIADAVSQQKLTTMANNIPISADHQQRSNGRSISDALRRKGHSGSQFSETHISSNTASRCEVPSTMASMRHASHLSSSVSRKRYKVAYLLSAEEQQRSPALMEFGLRAQEQQQHPSIESSQGFRARDHH